MKYYEWTKKLGQQCWSAPNKAVTFCNKAMLGNNYADHINNEDKTPCEICLLEITNIELKKIFPNL